MWLKPNKFEVIPRKKNRFNYTRITKTTYTKTTKKNNLTRMHVRRSKLTPYSAIQNLIDLECVSREQTWTFYSVILDLKALLAGFVNKKWFFF